MKPMHLWRPPSIGFCLIVLTWAATAALLVWGFSTPPMHRAWELLTRLNLENAAPPEPEEIHSVQQVLRRHPEWAPVLTGGRAAALLESPLNGCLRFSTMHLVVLPAKQAVSLHLHCPSTPQLRVAIEGTGEISCGKTDATFTLPAQANPQILRVTRLAGPLAYADDASCPITLLADENVQSFNDDAPTEDNDAAKD